MGISVLGMLGRSLMSAVGDRNYMAAAEAAKRRHALEMHEYEKQEARGPAAWALDAENALESARAALAAAMREVESFDDSVKASVKANGRNPLRASVRKEASKLDFALSKARAAYETALSKSADWARFEQAQADLQAMRADLAGLEGLARRAAEPDAPDLSSETLERLTTLRAKWAKASSLRDALLEAIKPKAPKPLDLARVVGGTVVSPRVTSEDIDWFMASPDNLALLKHHCRFVENLKRLDDAQLIRLLKVRKARMAGDRQAYSVSRMHGLKRAEARKLVRDKEELANGFQKLQAQRDDHDYRIRMADYWLGRAILRLGKKDDPDTTPKLAKHRARVAKEEAALQEFEIYAAKRKAAIEHQMAEMSKQERSLA